MENEEKNFLDRTLEPNALGTYIKKKNYAETSQKVKITAITPSQFEGKLVLGLEMESEEEDQLLTIGPKNQNELLELLGPVPRKWIGKTVTLTFGIVQDFEITRNGQKQTQSGVTVAFS